MQQHAGQVVHGSRAAKLKAAHVEAGRFMARMAQANPRATSFSIDTARGLTFNDGGVRTPLSLFHIVNFAEELKGTKQADRFDISGSSVTIHLNEFGLRSLRQFARAQRPEVPRKESKTLMHSRLLEAFKEREAKAVVMTRPEARPEGMPTASALLGPILQTLMNGPRSAEEIARLVSIRMRVSMDMRDAPYLENGTTFDGAVMHAVNYLIERRLLAHPSRQIGLTAAGRKHASAVAGFAAEDFKEPSAPVMVNKREKASAPLKVMTEDDILAFMVSLPKKSVRDLLVIWRNAVRIVSDETREPYHHQSRVMIRAIEHEWDQRSANADLVESFRWPDAGVRGVSKGDERNSRCFADLVDHGMLKEMGYTVGRNGLSSAVRQQMLTEIFRRSLPPVFPKPYMDQWGANGSARRLHKIADSLAAFARNASRMRGNYDEAISDWKEDLEYLHERHYAGQFGFGWPQRLDLASVGLKR